MTTKAKSKTARKSQSPVLWRDRYVETITVKAGSIEAHKNNPKVHGEAQKAALTGLLEEVGKVDSLKAYRNKKGDLVYWDGHARMSLNPDETWRVDVYDVSEGEVEVLLATFDPIGWEAEQSREKIAMLMENIQVGNADLMQFLSDQHEKLGLMPVEPPDDFKEVDEDLETQYQCPKCKYEWSGKPK